MKLNGLLGTGSGKLGSSVFATTGSVQVVRQYQPNVTNPNTDAQVGQRARFKLMSQVAAALSPVIVIPKTGLVSSRNAFIKKNAPSFYANTDGAQVSFENLQLTDSNTALPAILLSRPEAGEVMTISLQESAAANIEQVVFNIYSKNLEGQLELQASIIVTEAGTDRKFQTETSKIEGNLVVYAYGMAFADADARAKYGNYNVVDGTDIAKLVANRSISKATAGFTRTRGTSIYSGETESGSTPSGMARLYLTASGPGTVAGAGVFAIGSTVTARAIVNEGAVFKGWKMNGSNTYVSTRSSYSFDLNANVDLVADFAYDDPDPQG